MSYKNFFSAKWWKSPRPQSNGGPQRHRLECEQLDERIVPSTANPRAAAARPPAASFGSFSVVDASGDDSAATIFRGGALRLNYSTSGGPSFSQVSLEALRNNQIVATLGTFAAGSASNALINLASATGLTGDFQLRLRGVTSSNQSVFSSVRNLRIHSSIVNFGTFAANTFNYSTSNGTGVVFLGQGGTDTLNLNITPSQVASIDGVSLSQFNPVATQRLAVYFGSAYDFIRLTNGQEIYFQGIERLRFSNGAVRNLLVTTNDPSFASQWNLHVTDVTSAWRFTRGAGNILLASLDTGLLTAPGASGSVRDMTTGRLFTDSTDDDNFRDYGHGHSAISVMSSTPNNGFGVAGINWNSSVFVNDVYSGVTLQRAISDTISFARARGLKVVFQGGIQGEFWLGSGGNRAQLEALLNNNSDIALFAIAAGNGNVDIDVTDPNNGSVQQGLSGGVARYQSVFGNVMAVGALQHSGVSVNGLENASSVFRASYSNFGRSLTLMAPTDSPAVNKFGGVGLFGGTSCANPNMAAIASLVWSVNPSLNARQLRQVLIETAMDLGAAGKDTAFGNGLVNADAAVRRAIALAIRPDLARLFGVSVPAAAPALAAATTEVVAPATRGETGASASAAVGYVLSTAKVQGDTLAAKPVAPNAGRPDAAINRLAEQWSGDPVTGETMAYHAHAAEAVDSLLGAAVTGFSPQALDVVFAAV